VDEVKRAEYRVINGERIISPEIKWVAATHVLNINANNHSVGEYLLVSDCC